MKKLCALALALTLLLAGCAPKAEVLPAPSPTETATPSPVQTSAEVPRIFQATWLEVDETHRFWVALKETEEASPVTADPFDLGCEYSGLRVDFCDAEACTLTEDSPYSFLDGYSCQPYELVFSVGDWNFDGYNDLAFTSMTRGSRYSASSFYIWDPETERFLQNPDGLNRLNNPALHPDEQVITSYSTAAGGSEWFDHYCYQGGVLQPVRKCAYVIDWDTDLFTVTVEDMVDGVWQTVLSSEKEYRDSWVVYNRYREDLAHKMGPSGCWWGFPIDDTHDAFEVDTKGRLGTVLVTVELGEQDTSNDFGGYNTTLSVWDMADMDEPIQTMDMQIEGWAFGLSYVVDANFDGHTDFAYKYYQGVQAEMFDLWLWDEEKGQFVAEPAFSDISSPSVFEDTQTIEGWNRFSALGDGVSTVHRWEDGELVCVRRIETEALYEEAATITVEERVNGELKEVYHKEYLWEDIIDDTEETVPWIHERLVWSDLNYHGEESEHER